jgi:hypothetical protein
MATITFDAEELIGKLDAIRSSQLPYAGRRAMFQLATKLRKEAWPAYARRTFTSGNPVPFTTGGPGIRNGGLNAIADGLTVKIDLNRDAPGGQDPARYLGPSQKGGGQIYPTRFSRALKARGTMTGSFAYVWPVTENKTAFAGEINRYENVKPSFYSAVLERLSGKTTEGGKGTKYRGYRFFSVPDGRSSREAPQHLKPGIYRVKAGGSPTMLFAYLKRMPSISGHWSFEDFARQESEALLKEILPRTLEEALR